MRTGLDWRRIGTKPREWWRMDWIQLPGERWSWMSLAQRDLEGGSSVKMALFDMNGIAVVKAGEPIWSLEIISCWSRSNVELILFPKEKAGSNKLENAYIGPILQAFNEITALDISFCLPDTASTRKKQLLLVNLNPLPKSNVQLHDEKVALSLFLSFSFAGKVDVSK